MEQEFYVTLRITVKGEKKITEEGMKRICQQALRKSFDSETVSLKIGDVIEEKPKR